MTIRVLLFASYADAFGVPMLPLQMAVGSRVRDVLASLRADARASLLPPAPLLAVNAEYAELDRTLAEGDEVAIIPPVAGG
jgi:molybdopterin converting factor small subunit